MESVEELGDSIVLIDKSKNILAGAVETIKEKYKTNTYEITYLKSNTGEIYSQPGLFEVLPTAKLSRSKQYIESTLKLAQGRSINEVLTYLIPQVEIHELHEVIPSIHDIFVQKVTATA